ncbi:TetR/AcrR family transcriptional regulator [Streptomyces sp. NPDC093094]|uniref:TetR/AcrR family transcriptional regulator n=1 Tax=Streptomyces sp. NPDC093094 TaxID=3366026 RepID=UPI003804470E
MSASSSERRELIADSAIRIIARDGVRALTHRAVDREAHIPQGSTSYHAKTRIALIELIVDALTARSTTDAEALAKALHERLEQEPRLGPDELAALITGLVETLAARRDEMRARYALLLELDDASYLRARLTIQSEVHTITRQVTATALAGAGLPASDDRIEELIALTDSLVFHRTTVREPLAVRAILAAYLRGSSDAHS